MLWHTGHFVETISTEVVGAVAVDVAEVTGTMGRLGSGPVDVEEAEAARGLFVGLILPTLGIAVVCTLLLGLFRSIILTLRISIVGIAI